MRRAVVALIAAGLVAVPLAPVGAQEPPARALDASARASVLFGQIDVQPAFDPAWADSRAASSTIGSTALNASVWPSFLVDAFFFLYGFQSVERVALGIAEARYPQGPTEADATQSDLLFLNGGDPESVPGRFGVARSRAADRAAAGEVATGRVQLPVGRIGASESSSIARTRDHAESVAVQQVEGVSVGALEIEHIRGEARTTTEGSPAAEASLTIVGASVAGVPVEITDEGARAATGPAQGIVDAALADSGVTVRLLPESEEADAERAAASSGGMLVLTEVEADDPTGEHHSMRLGYLFGAADALARASTIDAVPPAAPEADVPPRVIDEVITIPGTGPVTVPPAAPGPAILRRTIITTTAATPVGARGAYAAVMLLGIGLLLVRPLVRAAARA